MSINREELFLCLTEILKEFDRVCKKNNLQYYLFAGTLLGAIRHKGIIPWDDDIDVAMPRADYNKLLELSATEFGEKFFLQTPATDKGYHKAFAKLRNSETTEIPYVDAAFDYNHGVFIDIFPLDEVPDDHRKFKKQLSKMKICVKLLHFAGRMDSGIGSLGLSKNKRVVYALLWLPYKLGLFNSKKVFSKYNELCAESEGSGNKRIGTIAFSFESERFIYEKRDFDEIIRIPFESILAVAPKNYDAILRKSYGEYMKPVKQKSEHGDVILDVKVSYKKYIAEHKAELLELWKKHRI